MLSPRNQFKPKMAAQNLLKLPAIPSRKHIHSQKKYSSPTPDLPAIKNQKSKKHIYIDNQNNSENVVNKKQLLENQIKARLLEVQNAEKVVHDIFGFSEINLELGEDLTNFQQKIQLNRGLIRKQRNKTQFQNGQSSLTQQVQLYGQAQIKANNVSQKQNFLKQANSVPLIHDLKLNIGENKINLQGQMKNSLKKQPLKQQNLEIFKSQRQRQVKCKVKTFKQNKVFDSIQQILSDPRKITNDIQSQNQKPRKFTISDLQDKLRKMNSIKFNNTIKQQMQNQLLNKQTNLNKDFIQAKSVGNIPVNSSLPCKDQTFKYWNKIQIVKQQNQPQNYPINKVLKEIKHYKSNFQNEIDQIKKLQMKSHKSIEKMVQNRKLLVDLRLIGCIGKKN